MHILRTDNMVVLQRRPQKRKVPAADYQHLSACLKSITRVWGSRNCVMTSSEMRAIHTRRHFPWWPTSTQKRIIRWSKMSKVWHIVHENPHFQGQGMQCRYQKCPRVNALQDSHWQHAGNSSSKPKKQLFHECQLVLWPILLDQTTNTHFLGTLRWVIVFTGSIWAPFRQWKALYHVYHKVL